MTASQLIVLNTAVSYARTVLSVILALFSIRWVFNTLGESDFGIFSLVGSIIVFVTFLNSVMSGSTGRYFAYYIGQGDSTEVNRWFNAALCVHFCLATLLITISWPVGEYFVSYTFNVPADRLIACLWLFRISLLSAFIGMASIPFVAMFTAKQRIAELAAWGTLQSVLTFFLAWFLNRAPGDLLVFYATGMAAILVFILFAQIFRAIIVFPECHMNYRLLFDNRRHMAIFSFAIWNVIGSLGGVLRNQGSAILLNLFFGPKVNAAYGIANQVAGQANQLSTAMMGAFLPEITSTEGRGERARSLSLSLLSSKLSTIFVMFFAIPLIIEINYILQLWIGEPPPYTALFCQLIMSTFMIDRLSAGYMLLVLAHGKIAGYQVTVGTSLLLTLPLAWLFLQLGFPPPSVGIAFIVMQSVCSLGRVLWGRHLFRVPAHYWLISVAFPCSLVAVASSLSALSTHLLFTQCLARLTLTFIISMVVTTGMTWFFALNSSEREFAGNSILLFLNKIGGK